MKKTIVMQFECADNDDFIDAFAVAVGHILSRKCAVKAKKPDGSSEFSMATVEHGEILMFTQGDIVADILNDVQDELRDALDNHRIVPDEVLSEAVKTAKAQAASKMADAIIAKASKTVQ